MSKETMKIYNSLKTAPPEALTPITAGRLKGKTDINPQWRYEALTEQFGPCGVGWRFTIESLWLEPGLEGQVFAFAKVFLSVKVDGEWSEPIPGIGGSMLIARESSGMYHNDEAYKMAVTDAIGTAGKMLGLAADVYRGLWDGSKYRTGGTSDVPPPAPQTPRSHEGGRTQSVPPTKPRPQQEGFTPTFGAAQDRATQAQASAIHAMLGRKGIGTDVEKHAYVAQLLGLKALDSFYQLSKTQASEVIDKLQGGKQ